MTRRAPLAAAAFVVAVGLVPTSSALANGGSGPQGTLEICFEDATLTIPAAQWWPYGYLGATKGACPEPTPSPTPEPTPTPVAAATPVVTPEPTPTSTPGSSPTPRPMPEPTPEVTPTPAVPVTDPTPTPTPTPEQTPVASSTAVVPRPADTGHGDSGRSHPLRAVLIAPTVAVALLFGARVTTRERGAR